MSRATQDTTRIIGRDVYGTITQYRATFQMLPLTTNNTTTWSYNPVSAETDAVWALPRSLATTKGIIIIFFSWG